MEDKTYDICVVGLGPAGSTFSRLLPQNLKILALDKKTNKEHSFKKPCGGLLSEDAQRCFARFGMTLPKEVIVDPQIFSVKTIDLNTRYLRYYQRHYINMDRHKFDMWLRSLIDKNVEIHDDVSCTKIKDCSDFYEITVLENGKENIYKAKYLIGADGANSIVRRQILPEHHIHTYMSVQQWFIDEHKGPFYSCIFDKELTDSYAWGLTKDGYFIFGGAFNMKGAREKFERIKEKLKAFDFILENPVKTEACVVLSPKSPKELCCGKGRCFLIGEAAGFISPSSLEGMSYAFESAYLLSKLFAEKNDVTLKDYKQVTRKLRFKLSLKLIKRHFIMGPFLRRLIMRAGIQAVTMAFPTKRKI